MCHDQETTRILVIVPEHTSNLPITSSVAIQRQQSFWDNSDQTQSRLTSSTRRGQLYIGHFLLYTIISSLLYAIIECNNYDAFFVLIFWIVVEKHDKVFSQHPSYCGFISVFTNGFNVGIRWRFVINLNSFIP